MEINIYSTLFLAAEMEDIKIFIVEFIQQHFKDILIFEPLEVRIVDNVLAEQSRLLNRSALIGSSRISGCYFYLNDKRYIVLDSFLFVMFSREVMVHNINGSVINTDESILNRNNAIYHEVMHMIIDKKRNTQNLPYVFDANTSAVTIINIAAERLYQEHEAMYLSQILYPLNTSIVSESIFEYIKCNPEITNPHVLLKILNELMYVIAAHNISGNSSISENTKRIISMAEGSTKENLAWFCGHCIMLQNRDIDVDDWINRLIIWLMKL